MVKRLVLHAGSPAFLPHPAETNPIRNFSNLTLTDDHTDTGGVAISSTRPPTMSPSPAAAAAPNPFWARFPHFSRDASAGVADEFARLASGMGWGCKAPIRAEMRHECFAAEYRELFGAATVSGGVSGEGAKAQRLREWQRLCGELGVEEVLGSITKCKKVSFAGVFLRGRLGLRWL